jgi:hypothetical protein
VPVQVLKSLKTSYKIYNQTHQNHFFDIVRFIGVFMKFLCLCMILSFSLFAGENDLKKDLKKLARKSSLITFEKTKDFDNNELLNHYLDNGTHKWVYH